MLIVAFTLCDKHSVFGLNIGVGSDVMAITKLHSLVTNENCNF